MLDLFRTVFSPPRDLILLVAAVWIGMSVSERRAARHAIDRAALASLIFYGVGAFILGGRLFYVAEHLAVFIQIPLGLLSPNTTIFDLGGACAAALITGLVYGQHKHLPALSTLDALTPLFACIAAGIGFSHLASGVAFGAETTLPWGINLWGANRQPTQIYEIIASLATLGLVLLRKPDPRPGASFLFFVALAAFSRLIIEGFRGDSTLVLGGVRSAQIIAWVILALSLTALELLRTPAVPRDSSFEQVVEVPESKPRSPSPAAAGRPKKTPARKAKAVRAQPRARKT